MFSDVDLKIHISTVALSSFYICSLRNSVETETIELIMMTSLLSEHLD